MVGFSQRAVWPLGALVLLLVVLHFLPLSLKHVFTVLFTAVLLAAAVAPAARFMARRGVPRGVTILVIYLLVLAVLAGVIALIVPLVVDEIDALRQSLPGYADDAQRFVARIAPDQAQNFSTKTITDRLSGELGTVASTLTSLIFDLVSFSITVILVLVIAFFLAVEEDFVALAIRRFVPPDQRPRVARVMGRIGTRMGQWARAQLLLALFFGVAFGAGLRIFNVHYAVTLGVIGGVLEVIPYVGGFLTVALAVLVALTQNPLLVIWVVAWYAVVVEIEGHVIAPKLMDRVLGIHPLVVVVALFLGGEALGILGALLAVPIAIVVQALLDEFYVFEPPSVAPAAVDGHGAELPSDKREPEHPPPVAPRSAAGRRR
ncbi:MAG TPA: AI-2E family transporter [Dehalococcoidia bacterium]|nr:AI-2E family transporter [Dehalococcoidia bacterium]